MSKMGFPGPDEDDGGAAVPNEDTAGVGGAPARDTGDGPGGKAGSFLGLRNWRLRSKLAAVLIIPTLTALALGTLRVIDDSGEAARFQDTADQVAFADKITLVVHELQSERSLAVAKIASGDASRQAGLDAQISKVDRAVDDLRASANQINPDDQDTRDRYSRGLQRLDALRPLRGAMNTSLLGDTPVLIAYSGILDSLVQLGREVTTAVANRDVLRLGVTVQAVSEGKEFIARGDAALLIASFRSSFPGDLFDQARSAVASGDASTAAFLANASPEQRQLYSDTFSGPEVDDRRRITTMAFSLHQQNEPPSIDNVALGNDSRVALDKLRAVETNLLGQLRAQADELATDAINSAWIGGAIVLLALLAALFLMLVIARLMLRPLRILRKTALDVAYTRLPETVQAILDDPDPVNASKRSVEPVPVTSRDEIGEVARSFDVVHAQAVKMAAEQALLRENVNGIFVNLSRRSQRLVERQLGVIDRLEADEQDPDHLASLFELDHLATRLRRNGESLLVLSGAGLAKSVPKPVPAADVIGAAVSEIEQYARIEIGIVPEVAVQGLTIHDLVHVLAELLDNATYFSEPETKVTVRAVITRKKALAIQVTDHGVGMTEERLAEVNQRLADPPDLDVSVTRRMGLYVVARLARRHGIEVRLRENEDIEGGVIARVVVPAELLTQMRPGVRTPPPSNRSETSMPSMPSVSEMSTSLPNIPASDRGLEMTPPPPSKPPASQPIAQQGGLVPLDQPISLDDLVAGKNAAGPFLSPAVPAEETPAWPTADDISPPNGDGASSGTETQFSSLVLPKREPKYTPVETPNRAMGSSGSSESERSSDEGKSALDDDVPTRRLPIYQSVLSRWFSEGDEAGADTPTTYTEPVEPDLPEQTRDTAADVVEPDVEDTPEEALPTRTPRTVPPETALQDNGWRSASDDGWQAAQVLYEERNDEITPAGLPKRVPNQYLVPGSIGGNEPKKEDSFADKTSGMPGTGAIARSATAARSRMASFQQGYKSGRHALKDRPIDALDDNGVPVTGGGSSADDSSKE
ncbi:histidine kinase [Amycolatopsis sp. WAC 01375]|uniref:sensor histidine kinase n=1 Tax=unclassified Amycolatopsis TaxID=2618356 RepID=UPI000F76C2C3|nr:MULTISPECIES: nitrate- and nitrite sensing domain-containing protein [unclassified Amycolatopsis]RSM81886.1 histidine kinase [Amycolatopsis sp. WAC 01375]RSN23909.1 histidine kinase [Amycolatopsis sp. WAC 01416]